MAKQTLPTRALLACGAVAGPMYVTVTMAEALTRDGFDLRQHRFSWLTTGDLGWIHQANMVLVGVLTVLLAVGVREMLRTGRGAVWGPRLLGLTGVAYIIGGLLRADPVAGLSARHHSGDGAHHLARGRPECLTWGEHPLPNCHEHGVRGMVRCPGTQVLGQVLRCRHPHGVHRPDRRRPRHRRQPRRLGLSHDALDPGDGAGRTPVPTRGNTTQ